MSTNDRAAKIETLRLAAVRAYAAADNAAERNPAEDVDALYRVAQDAYRELAAARAAA